MRVFGWVLAGLLVVPLEASGQGVAAGGEDELASRLLAALEALQAPADVWVALSPESTERLIAESAAADGDWQAAVARAGCEVTGIPPLRAIGEKWTFPTHLRGDGARARAVTEVLLGVPEELRSRLYAGAWIPSAPLTDRARQALSALCEHDPTAPSPDASDAVLSLYVLLDYAASAAGAAAQENRALLRAGLTAASDGPFLALTPESPLGLTLCYTPHYRLMTAAPDPPEPLSRALCPGAPWGPDLPLSALPVPPGAPAAPTERVALRLGDWAKIVGTCANEPETVVGEAYEQCLVVAPGAECIGRQVGAVVSSALGLGARSVGPVRFVGEPDARLSPEPGAETRWDGYSDLVDWALDQFRYDWRVATGGDMPEGDLRTLFGPGLQPLTSATAMQLWLLKHNGPAEWEQPHALRPAPGTEGETLAGRGALFVGVGLARVRAYGRSPTAEALFARLLTEAGLPPDAPLYAVDGGNSVHGATVAVGPSHLGLGDGIEGDDEGNGG